VLIELSISKEKAPFLPDFSAVVKPFYRYCLKLLTLPKQIQIKRLGKSLIVSLFNFLTKKLNKIPFVINFIV
jgi:hypothetical protein